MTIGLVGSKLSELEKLAESFKISCFAEFKMPEKIFVENGDEWKKHSSNTPSSVAKP